MIKLKSLIEYIYEYEGFRGWVSPNGEKFPIDDWESHGREESQKLLKRYYPSWAWEDNPNFIVNGAHFPAYALQFRGWIRVVGNGIYSTWQLTNQTAHNLRRLIEELEPQQNVKVDFYLGGSWDITAEEALEKL